MDRETAPAACILGLDPGETTGIAAYYPDSGMWITCTTPLWERLDDLISLIPRTGVVVMERFSLYPHKAKAKTHSTFPEVEVIGVIKYLCQKHSVPLVEQGADHKAFYSDQKLKELGVTEKSPHARDALRHALWYKTFKLEAA